MTEATDKNGKSPLLSVLSKGIRAAFQEKADLMDLQIKTARDIALLVEKEMKDAGLDYTARLVSVDSPKGPARIKVDPASVEVANARKGVVMRVDVETRRNGVLSFELWTGAYAGAVLDHQKTCSAADLAKELSGTLASLVSLSEIADARVAKTCELVGLAPRKAPKP